MFNVKIITPTGMYGYLNATILNITTLDGMRGILSNHMPLVTMIDIGKMTIGNDDEIPAYRYDYATGKGLLYFEDNLAVILLNTIERKDEIDLDRAEKSLQRAEQRLKNKSDVDVERALKSKQRAKNRIKIKNSTV